MQDTLLYILGVLIIAIGIALSIALHEVGHLLPAKLFRVKVTEFMIGFGPKIFSRKRGETEYGVRLLPFGGFVRMIGMYPPKAAGEAARDGGTGFLNSVTQDAREASAETIGDGEDYRTFYRLATWKKITVMLGGPLVNLLLGVLLYAVLLTGIGVTGQSTTIGSVSECLVAADSEQTECDAAATSAPAAAAGLLPGDRILSVDGEKITTWEQFRDTVSKNAETELSVTVARGEDQLQLRLTPAANSRYVTDEMGRVVKDSSGKAQIETVGMIGATAATELQTQPITEVPRYVGENIKQVTGVILNLPQRLIDVWNAAFGAEERDPNGPISVVGVGRIAGEIATLDTVPVIAKVQSMVALLAGLNIALFVFNLIPLMPLDGGHIAGALYEKGKRSLAKLLGRADPGPIDTARMVPVTLLVVAVLGAMSLLLIYADLVKPVTLG